MTSYNYIEQCFGGGGGGRVVILPLGGHLAMCGDLFDRHDSGEGCSQHWMSLGQGRY